MVIVSTINCTQLILDYTVLLLRPKKILINYFDDAKMMDHNCLLLLIKIINTATIYHAHGLIIL